MAAFSGRNDCALRFLFPIQFAEFATIEAKHIAEFERHTGLELATERCLCALTHGVALGHRQTTTLLGLKILRARFHGSGSGLRSGGLPAEAFSAEPSADTLVLLPIRMIVNETDLPDFAKLRTTILALLITDERESHPCPLMVER